MSGTAIRQVRLVGILEGISFLVLLGIAMPLKYLAGKPEMVSWVGMAHGVLFVIYVAAIIHAQIVVRWPIKYVVGLLAAAVFPLGPFFAEGWLRKQERVVGEREAARLARVGAAGEPS
jgi:integral membrane protein